MLITCHNLNKSVPTDMAFIQGRARAETMRAEDVLHDVGAISDDRLRQPGRRPRRGERAARLPARGGQQGALRPAVRGRLRQRQFPHHALPRQGHDQPGDHASASTPTSARSRRASSPTSSSGGRNSSSPSRKLIRQGRLHLVGRDGRPGRLADDLPAAQVPAAVRLARRQPAPHCSYSFVTQAAIDAGLAGRIEMHRR